MAPARGHDRASCVRATGLIADDRRRKAAGDRLATDLRTVGCQRRAVPPNENLAQALATGADRPG